MINQKNCPKCERNLSSVNVKDIKVIGGVGQWDGAAYTCPHCNTILSVGIDPIVAEKSIVANLIKALKS